MNSPLDFLSLAESRFSVRRFADKPLSPEDMERILAAGRVAPTACNRQPQRILVLEGEEDMARLRRCTPCHFNAPACILVAYDAQEEWTRDYDGAKSGAIDASIVATHMMLEAASIGVGMTWVMYFIPEAVREELSLPASYEPVALLMAGYPAPNAAPSAQHGSKKPASETIFRSRF